MSLKPEHRDRDEIEYYNELGWLAALSVVIVSFALIGF